MGEVIALRRRAKPVRLDLPPCDNAWGPYACATAAAYRPHKCWTWRGWPHVCRCMRCGTRGAA